MYSGKIFASERGIFLTRPKHLVIIFIADTLTLELVSCAKSNYKQKKLQEKI